MFKCSFVLPRLYFCVLSLVFLLCSYSAFVSTCLLLLYMCIVLLYKINIVYIAFVQNPCWFSMQSCSMVSLLNITRWQHLSVSLPHMVHARTPYKVTGWGYRPPQRRKVTTRDHEEEEMQHYQL